MIHYVHNKYTIYTAIKLTLKISLTGEKWGGGSKEYTNEG